MTVPHSVWLFDAGGSDWSSDSAATQSRKQLETQESHLCAGSGVSNACAGHFGMGWILASLDESENVHIL
jgi:hypothetical protein